jgi:hypothetical protein
MEQNSSEVEALRCLVNDLYNKDSKHLQSYPFRDLKDILPFVNKEKDDFEFLKAFMLRPH